MTKTNQWFRSCATAVTLCATAHSAVAAVKGPETLDDRCWQQSYEDQFDELNLWDNSKQSDEHAWHTSYIWPRDVIINNEEQYYLDPRIHGISPFSIQDSVLSITATHTPTDLLDQVAGQPYISGVLTGENGFSQKYGRFEVRAKAPKGQGLWSAFWLLPSFEQWPAGIAVLPEIDVMEHLGHQPNVFHTTLHTNQTGELTSHPYDHTESVDLTENFHTYSVVWNEQSVNWYLDGQWRAAHPTPADYTRPVHFLLNLAVGGNWPGSPDASTRFPARFEVDFVRAYTEAPECAS